MIRQNALRAISAELPTAPFAQDQKRRSWGRKISVAILSLVHSLPLFGAPTNIDNGGTTFISVDKNASNGSTGSATILLTPTLSTSHIIGTFATPTLSGLSGGSVTTLYSLWNGSIGTPGAPVAAGSKGNLTFYEGNIETNQSKYDATNNPSGDVPDGEAIRILAGTVSGHGGAMLGGSAININSDTTAATIIGHNLGILKDVAGATQYGFYSNMENTAGPPATSLKGTAGFIALNNWDVGFHANTYGYSGTAAFKAEGNWDAGFDGGGLPLKNLGAIWGNQTIYASNVSLKLLGGVGEWNMQTVDANGRFRVYEQTYGELYAISRASPAVHTFTGNAAITGTATITGNTTVSSLAGTGSRTVVASSTGLLSAPTSDARLKRNMTPVAEQVDVLALLEDSGIRGIFYDWKDPGLGTEREIGFTAQMFEDVPGLTGTMNDTGHAYLNYERVTALLWEQNRLLLAQNKAMLAKYEALLERVKAVESTASVRY